MKKMRLILIVVVLITGCSSKKNDKLSLEDIQDTKWRIEIADGCISSLYFIADRKYKEYNCEMEDTLFGTYELVDNKIILLQEGSIYDNLYEAESPHRIGKAKFKLSIEDGKLRFLMRENYVDEKWVKSNIIFPEDYLYQKF